MLQIRRVLFPTDFSDAADAAFVPALRFAELHGAELHVLHAVVLHADDPHAPEHHFPEPERVASEMGRIAEEKLEKVTTGVATAEVEVVRAQRRSISAAPAILDYAAEHEVDLIVLGTHGRRGLRRLFLGSVAEEVIRGAECPVVAVRGPEEKPWRSREVRRIVVPTDFSGPADLALKHAERLAAATGARLDLLHVLQVENYPDFYYPVRAMPIFDRERLREDAEEALERFVERVEIPTSIETATHVADGRAVDEIVAFCDAAPADLLVMATRGRTGLERLALGSVAEGVLRRAPCPVLLVKPTGRSLLTAGEEAAQGASAT